MSTKTKKSYSREFNMEAVGLVTEKGYSIAEASRNLGIEHSVLRRWKKKLTDDLQYAFPEKGRLKAPAEELRRLKRELEGVQEERDILKEPWSTLRRIRNEISIHHCSLGDVQGRPRMQAAQCLPFALSCLAPAGRELL